MRTSYFNSSQPPGRQRLSAPDGSAPDAQRVDAVDALRGFALLGVLLTNIPLFSGPMSGIFWPAQKWPAWHDRAAEWFIRFAGEGKFYTLFSLLFGLSFAIQMIRAQATGRPFVVMYVRRLLILLAIGLAHLFLLWSGDILTTYALVGFLLLLFRNARPRMLLSAAAATLVGMLVLVAAGILLIETTPALHAAVQEHPADVLREMAQEAAAYQDGSYLTALRQRIADLDALAALTVFVAPIAFAMFLLGLFAGRTGMFRGRPADRAPLKRVLVFGLAIGIPGNLLYAALYAAGRDYVGWGAATMLMVQVASAPALALAYAAAVLLAWNTRCGRAALAPLTPVGRMALTSYLLQSLVCTTLFYGYGLGWYGEVGPAAGVGLTLLIYAGQVLLSSWWMSRHAYGPVEWLWRWGTHLRRPPWRNARTT